MLNSLRLQIHLQSQLNLHPPTIPLYNHLLKIQCRIPRLIYMPPFSAPSFNYIYHVDILLELHKHLPSCDQLALLRPTCRHGTTFYSAFISLVWCIRYWLSTYIYKMVAFFLYFVGLLVLLSVGYVIIWSV